MDEKTKNEQKKWKESGALAGGDHLIVPKGEILSIGIADKMPFLFFPPGDKEHFMQVSTDGMISFNREAYPEWEADDFAMLVIDTVEALTGAKCKSD